MSDARHHSRENCKDLLLVLHLHLLLLLYFLPLSLPCDGVSFPQSVILSFSLFRHEQPLTSSKLDTERLAAVFFFSFSSFQHIPMRKVTAGCRHSSYSIRVMTFTRAMNRAVVRVDEDSSIRRESFFAFENDDLINARANQIVNGSFRIIEMKSDGTPCKFYYDDKRNWSSSSLCLERRSFLPLEP